MTGGGIASGVSCSKKLPLRNVTARLHPLPTKWGNFGMPDRHRLVIVDDEAELRAMVAEYLGRHGYAVSTAGGGDELDACLADTTPTF